MTLRLRQRETASYIKIERPHNVFYLSPPLLINIVCNLTFYLTQKYNFSFNRRYDDDPETAWSCGSWCEYIFVVILSSILLVGVLALTVFWIIYYRGKFAWSDQPDIQFNLHPVLMIAGFITFSGFCKNLNVFFSIFLTSDQTNCSHFSSSNSSLSYLPLY